MIASVANYLHEAGWRLGAPVLAEATVPADVSLPSEPHSIELNETVASLPPAASGRSWTPQDTPAVLILAEQQSGPAYRVGFHNFYVITRYNTSPRYAMAVHDLAQAIAAAVREAPAAPAAAPTAAPPTNP